MYNETREMQKNQGCADERKSASFELLRRQQQYMFIMLLVDEDLMNDLIRVILP